MPHFAARKQPERRNESGSALKDGSSVRDAGEWTEPPRATVVVASARAVFFSGTMRKPRTGLWVRPEKATILKCMTCCAGPTLPRRGGFIQRNNCTRRYQLSMGGQSQPALFVPRSDCANKRRLVKLTQLMRSDVQLMLRIWA